MASRKRKLTPAQVAALLAQSSDSETYDSEFDDSDNDSNSDVDGDDSDQTVDYMYHENSTDFDWSATASARPRTMFSGKPGLQVAVDNPDDPLAFFSLFFTPEIVNVIVTETTRSAAQLISQMRARPHARLNNWSDTNANEIRVFIAVLLYQGIVQKPTVDSYWTTRSLLSTPYVRYIITRDRFALLLQISRQ